MCTAPASTRASDPINPPLSQRRRRAGSRRPRPARRWPRRRSPARAAPRRCAVRGAARAPARPASAQSKSTASSRWRPEPDGRPGEEAGVPHDLVVDDGARDGPDATPTGHVDPRSVVPRRPAAERGGQGPATSRPRRGSRWSGARPARAAGRAGPRPGERRRRGRGRGPTRSSTSPASEPAREPRRGGRRWRPCRGTASGAQPPSGWLRCA